MPLPDDDTRYYTAGGVGADPEFNVAIVDRGPVPRPGSAQVCIVALASTRADAESIADALNAAEALRGWRAPSFSPSR